MMNRGGLAVAERVGAGASGAAPPARSRLDRSRTIARGPELGGPSLLVQRKCKGCEQEDEGTLRRKESAGASASAPAAGGHDFGNVAVDHAAGPGVSAGMRDYLART